MSYKKLHKQRPQTAKKAPKQNSHYLVSADSAANREALDFLWQTGRYEELERTLKIQKQDLTGILIENLSKLAFFQHEKKLTGTGAAFASHVLTGGACLIARDPAYHNDIADEIRLLANEIKLLFAQVKIKNKHALAWEQAQFDIFVDLEASVLTQVLQLAVKSKTLNIDFIPSPGYLAVYQVTNKPLGQQFLRWLASENSALSQMYHRDTYHAAFWALSGGSLSDINSTLKSADTNTFHPYLCLALMLRSANMKKSVIKDIVQLSDFKKLKEINSVSKNIAIQAVKHMLSKDSKSNLTPAFWQLLIDFYPVLEEPELKGIIIAQLINKLQIKYKAQTNLELNDLKNIACQINADELVKAVDTLYQRQLTCSQFMKALEDKKQAKKRIANIKDQPALVEHFTLIADTYCLLYSELSLAFYRHLLSLITNKKINKLISFEEYFEYLNDCDYDTCQRDLYQSILPKIIDKLRLPVALLPTVDFCSTLTSITAHKQMPKVTVLSQTNPFKILDVSLADSKPIIMQKVLKLIQQSPGQMAIFRKAQNELFNPSQRFLHHYFRYFAEFNSQTDMNAFSLSDISQPIELINAH